MKYVKNVEEVSLEYTILKDTKKYIFKIQIKHQASHVKLTLATLWLSLQTAGNISIK